MSDCRVPEPQGYDVARLRIEFGDGEVPWMYPLALNGRSIRGVYVDGERYTHERTCHAIAIYNMHDEWCGDECSACGYEWYEDEPNYCPRCGARVKEGDDD